MVRETFCRFGSARGVHSRVMECSLLNAYLEKCGGWEDTRSPEEIIADIEGSSNQ
jgi:hypothetical protein